MELKHLRAWLFQLCQSRSGQCVKATSLLTGRKSHKLKNG